MTSEELIAKIRNCEAEANLCRRLTADESLPLNERLGAQMGELDWIVSAQMYREDLQKLFSFTESNMLLCS